MPHRISHTLHRTGMVLLALPLSACSAAGPGTRPVPTTNPSLQMIQLSDAVPLEQLQVEQRQANLTQKLSKPQASRTLYFGELDVIDEASDDEKPLDAVPILAIKKHGKWLALPLVGPGLKEAGWAYVAAGPASGEIWGALDTAAGATRGSFVLAHSTDGGETFQLKVFRKPTKAAEFFDFAMSSEGHGRATVWLEMDTGSHKAGLYHYETTDDGKTWSAVPRYEPDAMDRADTVPDDEQPDASESGTKTSSLPTRPPAYARR